VKILFDTNIPAPLAGSFRGHDVARTGALGWQNLENGALLEAAEKAGFEVLITCDQNVRYQQNFTDRKLAVVVILSSNHWPTLRPVAVRIASVVDFMQRGQVKSVDVTSL
jgi:predicted nuclease of predicted toxin-antitoxin system